MNTGPDPTSEEGSGKMSSMSSSARIGVPAATRPSSGTSRTPVRGEVTPPVSTTSMALGLEGSRRRWPSFTSADRWLWTVEGELRPSAAPISRTDGG